MGDLYNELKFSRKGAFFKRVAAMHCVNPLLPNPQWRQCYQLIIHSFPGFNMSFDPKQYRHSGELARMPTHFLSFQSKCRCLCQFGNALLRLARREAKSIP